MRAAESMSAIRSLDPEHSSARFQSVMARLDHRPCPLKVYINGKLYDKEDAKISVYDHGLLYGDGVFEGIRSYGGKVFRLEAHLDRLWNSAKAIWLTIPISKRGNGRGHRRDAGRQRHRGRLHPRWSSRAAAARWASTPTAAATRR